MADYHVYELRLGADAVRRPHPVASCDGDSLAFTLDTLVAEGQLTDSSDVGILRRPDGEPKGVWIVCPFTDRERGR